MMAIAYGSVPIIREASESTSADDLMLKQEPFYNVIDWADQEMLEASKQLPATQTEDKKYGRVTSVGCLAMRARILLFAASDLVNGNPALANIKNIDGTPIFNSAHDPERWKRAVDACKLVIDEAEASGYHLHYEYLDNGDIDPFLSYQNAVMKRWNEANRELLFVRTMDSGGWYDKNCIPRGLGINGVGAIGITQSLVDAFFMSNGLEINDSGSGYSEEGFADLPNRINEDKRVDKNVYNMYHGREPRFYAAITYEGRSWHVQPPGNANYVTSFAKGGDTDLSRLENPKTGYMLYKFKNRQVYGTTRPASGGKLELFKQWARPNILLRLADFYLYYAEACNEVDPGDPNVIEYLDRVRRRAGIPGYKELKEQGKKDIIGNQEKQRWAIQRERQVEFLCEGQRYFDVRRWMTANDANNPYDQQITRSGMDMTQPNQGVGVGSFFNRVVLERRAWTRAMLLYPIPYTEIQRSPGKILIQNPLW